MCELNFEGKEARRAAEDRVRGRLHMTLWTSLGLTAFIVTFIFLSLGRGVTSRYIGNVESIKPAVDIILKRRLPELVDSPRRVYSNSGVSTSKNGKALIKLRSGGEISLSGNASIYFRGSHGVRIEKGTAHFKLNEKERFNVLTNVGRFKLSEGECSLTLTQSELQIDVKSGNVIHKSGKVVEQINGGAVKTFTLSR